MPNLTPESLGQAIRKARRAQGLSQTQVAEALGFSQQWISEIESGKPNARIGAVLDVADAVGLEITANPR
ncbi:helix-turn-helix domain-containing protein [Hyphobacterium sp.]|uniref:helix-turn-helix domain-containing protein n=1 Tax=Hyphobacterium sp. TaxID=2004662 RepID=UPI003BA8E2DE